MSSKKERRHIHVCECPVCQQTPDGTGAEEHRAINRIIAAVDERNRRLFVGLLARRHGRGGITLLARITGLSPHTIRRGQRELRHGSEIMNECVRRPGGGRHRTEKKVPGS